MKPMVLISVLLLAGGACVASARAQSPYNDPSNEPYAAPRPRLPPGGVAPSLRQPAAGPDYGGGFIELILTGREPAPRRWGQQSLPYGSPGGPSADQGYGEPDGSLPVRPTQPRWRTAGLPDPAVIEPLQQEIPARYQRQVVEYDGRQQPGTIVIDTADKYLYLVGQGGTAIRYGIGVGREGFVWHGTQAISMKREWPEWRPPGEMLKRRPELPRYMAGGPDNPLGARALYLGSTLFRIHGTNEPHTIGHNVSSGCIRLTNEDVIDLYGRVGVGTRVVVM
jgi:lipoprotein-anchoring transpeptidase ErfK/SrfK